MVKIMQSEPLLLIIMTMILSLFLMVVDVSSERPYKAYVDSNYCVLDIYDHPCQKVMGGQVMLVKWGVWGTVHEELVKKFSVITKAWDPIEPVVTSIGEGTHSPRSKHYYTPSKAIDLRIPNFKEARIKSLKEGLGKMFTVIDEGNHIHIQYNG